MAAMSHRERVVKALNHEEPDRVPIAVDNINAGAYINLVKHLGVDEELQRPELNDQSDPSKTLILGPTLLERFDVDVRPLNTRPLESVHEQIDAMSYRDGGGVVWSRSEKGPYMNKQGPFQGRKITLADLDRHPWPDPNKPGRYEGLRERARKMHEETDYAIMGHVGPSSVGPCQRLRGFTEWMEDLALEPALAEGLLEHVTEVVVACARAILQEVGDYLDVVRFADDLGFQDRAYFRPEMFRRQVKPYLGRMVEAIKSNTRAKVLMHSDGSIYHLLPDLIDIGVEAINPVQTTAKNMEAARLKAEFGDHLGFWGAIDTQHTLPFGTPDEVRDEVRSKIRELGPSGGFILGSCHEIQREVPPENVVAMYDSAIEFGKYQQTAAV